MDYNKKLLIGKTALVVEDHPAYNENVTSHLQTLGLDVISTFSLLQALKVASEQSKPIDIALIDVYLPLDDGGIDHAGMGFYLAAILKTLWGDIPIIGISNYIEEITESERSVFSDLLRKRELFMQRNGIQKLSDVILDCLKSIE